ncbi:MAG: translocation/assembly module TamB [Muribaculaceae bacterium]|nr:translocation/assembly module TamB [Muribaculaceae bacterium]
MSATKSIYKVFRSIAFTVFWVVIGLFAGLYITLWIPAVQDALRKKAETEISAFLGGKVEIGNVDIIPFNEVRLEKVAIYTPEGQRCITIGTLGAGISLWSLLSTGQIVVNYAEIISLDAKVAQKDNNGPLNIDFIIKAFAPKDKNKPPTPFDVVLRNVVIRKSRLSFDRNYLPHVSDSRLFDVNHICLTDVRADVALPVLKNDSVVVDLHRLAFDEISGLSVNSLSFGASVSPRDIVVNDFTLRLVDSDISVSDVNLKFDGYDDLLAALRRNDFDLLIKAAPLTLSEFACFLPQLTGWQDPCRFEINLKGTFNKFYINKLEFENFRNTALISLEALVEGISDPKALSIKDASVMAIAPTVFNKRVLELIPNIPDVAKQKIEAAGDLKITCSGDFNLASGKLNADASLDSEIGSLLAQASVLGLNTNFLSSDFKVIGENLDLGILLNDSRLGPVSLESEGAVRISGRQIEGMADVLIPKIFFSNRQYENFSLNIKKINDTIDARFESNDPAANLNASVECLLAGAASETHADLNLYSFYPAAFGLGGFKDGETISLSLAADLLGNNPDDVTGKVQLSNFVLDGPGRSFNFDNLFVEASKNEDLRHYSIDSDVLNGTYDGTLSVSDIVNLFKDCLADVAPIFFKSNSKPMKNPDGFGRFSFDIVPSDNFYSLIHSPVRPGLPISIKGNMFSASDSIRIDVDAPYLIQGKNKLLKNSSLVVSKSAQSPCRVKLSTDFPLKNDRAVLGLGIAALKDSTSINIDWHGVDFPENKGSIGISGNVIRDYSDNSIDAFCRIARSSFILNDTIWNINPASLSYQDKTLDINNLTVSEGHRSININGTASAAPDDEIAVVLNDIDLAYIFDLLNINFVDFGGNATGIAKVSSAFSKTPMAFTDGLFVRNLAYNDCVLGDAHLESHWDNNLKMVAINADIHGEKDSGASVKGGVYVTRDSLSFNFGAKHVNMKLLQPFMSAFTSSVEGHASGNIKLFGTFSDIDLVGAAHADDISMLVDYTNVRYFGSDSVFFYPGKIVIPHIELQDKFGGSCMFQGTVTHKFLKDASFDFKMTGARKLLAYDTDSKFNNKWFGRVFTNGNASLKGGPGFVALNLNLSTAPDSEFTLVLDETQEAADYTFLTFSDRRKEALQALDVSESFEDKFKMPGGEDKSGSDVFSLGMSLDITPDVKMVIVMDPKAGDKITAHGAGGLQLNYNTQSDALSIYGKYTLAKGWYNFSLQDLILKNFKIESGSSISFNGDPLRGVLDITAAYRVNTNLKDLDNSFASDPDLNRTVIPVDALLKVNGDISAPEINFDLSLPTVTSDVERKVRSIISTEDMLNRQVIYLLALNRFYAPEYMGVEQGGEIASVASSTLSSQVQNIIGSLTDKFVVAPSFKSEKSDLSDMEVDLALSSSFFDNRLLLNGNLGYRDKSTSQTTFVGDFDLEYLLSRDGKFRLKAYNHFNDASYYLRSALTTQGIGVIYRKEFDDPFKFIKEMFRKKPDKGKE